MPEIVASVEGRLLANEVLVLTRVEVVEEWCFRVEDVLAESEQVCFFGATSVWPVRSGKNLMTLDRRLSWTIGRLGWQGSTASQTFSNRTNIRLWSVGRTTDIRHSDKLGIMCAAKSPHEKKWKELEVRIADAANEAKVRNAANGVMLFIMLFKALCLRRYLMIPPPPTELIWGFFCFINFPILLPPPPPPFNRTTSSTSTLWNSSQPLFTAETLSKCLIQFPGWLTPFKWCTSGGGGWLTPFKWCTSGGATHKNMVMLEWTLLTPQHCKVLQHFGAFDRSLCQNHEPAHHVLQDLSQVRHSHISASHPMQQRRATVAARSCWHYRPHSRLHPCGWCLPEQIQGGQGGHPRHFMWRNCSNAAFYCLGTAASFTSWEAVRLQWNVHFRQTGHVLQKTGETESMAAWVLLIF